MTAPTIPPPSLKAPEADKRKDLRVPLRVLKVETELNGDVFFGYAADISKSGLFIQTSNPRPVGTKVRLMFVLPGTKEKLTFQAEVIWNRNYIGKEGLTPGMGMRFVELDSTNREKIEKFVDTAA